MEEKDVSIVQQMEACKLRLDELKKEPEKYDGRAISIAITNLETAMLWFANAKKG